MNSDNLIELAEKYCKHYHSGEFRKGSNLPYYTHPFAVAKILYKFGYTDTIIQCSAILHDTVESGLSKKIIYDRFGYEIGHCVEILSRNTVDKGKLKIVNKFNSFDIENLTYDEIYNLRLISEPDNRPIIIKIGDTIHNTQDLQSLRPESIIKKINDAEKFYIPMGMKIDPILTRELEKNILNYKHMKNI